MFPAEAEELARQLLNGQLTLEEFVGRVTQSHTADVGDAQVDLHRPLRCGFPEVVFAEGKTVEAIETIFAVLLESGADAFATRVSPEQADALQTRFAAGRYNALGRTFRVPAEERSHETSASGKVVIVTAGTSDRPVAEEACETALWAGCRTETLFDVGVAGPHRLVAHIKLLRSADAVVVIAGMEGALPSVVGGHVDCPVIAVPTSVGYGASFGGVAALLGMLNSCASNVTVVNIDAGFKGAYVAAIIARRAAHRDASSA